VDALVVHGLAGKQRRQHFQGLVELRCAVGLIADIAEGHVVGKVRVPGARAERNAAAGELVQREELAGELSHVATRHRCHQRAESNGFSAQSHGRQGHPRVRHRLDELQVVPDEEAVPPGLLSLRRQVREYPGVAAEVEVGCVEAEAHRAIVAARRAPASARNVRISNGVSPADTRARGGRRQAGCHTSEGCLV
jgi:hypothetical protein